MTEDKKKKEMNFKEVKIFIMVTATFLRNLAEIVNKKLFFFFWYVEESSWAREG